MPTALSAVHDQLVREAADRYIQKGSLVQIDPNERDLPEFLRTLPPPDLLVTTPTGDKIFVEVKVRGRIHGVEYWNKLKALFQAHPDWRFELVVDNKREQEIINASQPLLSLEEIESRLLVGQRLAEEGLTDGGLLITWSALEAILRRISQQKRVDLTNNSPTALFTQLVFEGFLDRDDYRILMQILPARDQAAHGHQSPGLDRALVEQTIAIARRLMKPLSRSSRRRAQKSTPKEQPV